MSETFFAVRPQLFVSWLNNLYVRKNKMCNVCTELLTWMSGLGEFEDICRGYVMSW